MSPDEPTGRVASEPYPWPYDGLDSTSLAVVIAGWGNHWRDRCVTDPATELAQRGVVEAVREAGGLVVTVEHVPLDAGGGLPLDRGAPSGAVEVRAHGVDGFYGTDLDLVLRTAGRSQIVLVGHGLEGPVHSTMRSANDRGYECVLVTDACTPIDRDLVAAAVSSVCMSGGIFGAVTTAEALVEGLGALPDPPPDRPPSP